MLRNWLGDRGEGFRVVNMFEMRVEICDNDYIQVFQTVKKFKYFIGGKRMLKKLSYAMYYL